MLLFLEHCSDGKKNEDEEGKDCGGSCPACPAGPKPAGPKPEGQYSLTYLC